MRPRSRTDSRGDLRLEVTLVLRQIERGWRHLGPGALDLTSSENRGELYLLPCLLK